MASHIFVFGLIESTIHKINPTCFPSKSGYLSKTKFGYLIAKGNIIEGIEAKE